MSELDDRLSEGRAAVATMGPPADLWAQVVEHSNDGDAAVLDPTIARQRRRPSLWLAVAAVLALIVVVGTLMLRDDDHTIDTVPADTSVTTSTTTGEPITTTFAIPFAFELPDDWALVEEGHTFYRLGMGPVSGLPQTKIEFAVPEGAATVEEAAADLAAKAPSLFVLGDPIHTTVVEAPATCMDVQATDDGSSAPLFHFRLMGGDQPPVDRAITLEEGAVGRVCVIDARGYEGESPLIVLIQAPAAEFAAFMTEAQVLLSAARPDG